MPPLVLVAVAWVGGLIIAHHWLVPLCVDPLVLLPLGLVPLGALVLYRDERNTRLGAACALAFLLGALRYQLAVPDLTDPDLVSQYNGAGRVTVEGVVVEYPDVGDTRTQLVLETEAVDVAGTVHPVHGRVLVYAPRYPAYVYGDRLRVSGELEAPQASPDFNYPGYLARQGIYSHVFSWEIEKVAGGEGAAWQAALFAVKDRAVAALGRLLPDPEAALLQGIVLGVEGSIPDALYEDFNATGTSHIIVISGANIAVIATLFAGLFGALLGKRRAYLLTLAGIAGYVLLVGADAPVARAGLMGALYVTARHTGRRATAYVSLFAAAAVLTAMTPTALWGAGFQLSFAATLSLCLFTPPLERRLRGRLDGWLGPDRAAWAGRVLSEALVGTIAAQILVLPLIAYHFGRVSPVSPLANLLIVPVQPPIMALGGAAA
ncbi:MAG: ComEC/Rec2 family competence protein, partial [Anaerolineae bacterium]